MVRMADFAPENDDIYVKFEAVVGVSVLKINFGGFIRSISWRDYTKAFAYS
jgi:hypothetical protein